MTLDVHTEPHLDRAALLTIDTQRDVLDGGPLEIAGTTAVLPRMAQLLAAFRAARRPIVHVVRLYRAGGVDADRPRRAMLEAGACVLQAGTDGAQLAPELLADPAIALDADLLLDGGLQRVGADEVVMFKPRWGAFYRTPLQAHLDALDVTTVVVAGCNFPNCPRTTVYEASERDYRVVLVDDAVSGLYDRGRDELRGIGVALLDTAAVVAGVRATATL